MPLIAAIAPMPAIAAPRDVVALGSGWQVRIDPADTAAARAHPRAARWLKAVVPGTVQEDLIRQKIVPDPYLGLNERAIQWAGLTDWQYRRTLRVTGAMLARDHLDLVFDGLDTFATVTVNGRKLLTADNAHRRWRADAKPLLREGDNIIEIGFASPIKRLQPMVLALANPLPGEYDSAFGDEPKGKQTSPYIRKPKYQYGWDWGPRIVAIGPWRGVQLEAWDDARVDAMLVKQEAVTAANARINAVLRVIAARPGRAAIAVVATGPDGRPITVNREATLAAGENTITVPVAIDNPALWYPVGLGAHPLYTLTATLAVDGRAADSATRRTGLRTVTLLNEKGGFGLTVNGMPVFMRGANLIPLDAFPARVPPETQRRLLRDAVAANMNMIRVWGGGYYPDDDFYDTADALGLMVWQDFIFGGAITPPDASFRANVAAEAAQQVERLQAHPSLVIWAGNNEVLSSWANWSNVKAFKQAVGADEQERVATGLTVLFDRVLREAVVRGDPDVPYWPGSPSTDYDGPVDTDAAGDRHFWDVWSGSKPVEMFAASCPRFMSEYGFQAFPDLSTIARFASPADRRADSPVMEAHQKFLAGKGNERILFYLRQNLRDPRDFGDLVYLSQAMQARAIDIAARHHRACRPTNMGSLYWQLNDVWPGASWSSVDWYGQWKLLHYQARRFFAPQAIVAEHRDGATRIALVSDAADAIPARWRVRAFAMDGKPLGTREGAVTLAPQSSADVLRVGDADLFADAAPAASYAVAELTVSGEVVSRQVIERVPPRAMAYPAPGLTAKWSGKELTITATRLARMVGISFGTITAQPSDDGFDLLPGESRTVTVDSTADARTLARTLTLSTLGPR